MTNNNESSETRALIASIIVADGDDIGFSEYECPMYLIDKFYSVFREAMEWQKLKNERLQKGEKE